MIPSKIKIESFAKRRKRCHMDTLGSKGLNEYQQNTMAQCYERYDCRLVKEGLPGEVSGKSGRERNKEAKGTENNQRATPKVWPSCTVTTGNIIQVKGHRCWRVKSTLRYFRQFESATTLRIYIYMPIYIICIIRENFPVNNMHSAFLKKRDVLNKINLWLIYENG